MDTFTRSRHLRTLKTREVLHSIRHSSILIYLNAFIFRILIGRGANLLSVNADGNMPYDICEDEQALDFIESEMAKNGVTQQLIDETRAGTERKMLTEMKALAQKGESLEQYDSQGATPVSMTDFYLLTMIFTNKLIFMCDSLPCFKNLFRRMARQSRVQSWFSVSATYCSS